MIYDLITRGSESKTYFISQPIKRQCCPHKETSPLICSANQLTGFYMRAKLALNGLILFPEPYFAINSQYMKNFTINFAIYEI